MNWLLDDAKLAYFSYIWEMSRKNIAYVAVLVILVLVMALTCNRDPVTPAEEREIEEMEFELGFAEDPAEEAEVIPVTAKRVYYSGKKLAYSSIFADVNDLHIEAASSVGLKSPVQKRDHIDARKMGLVQIFDTKSYVVANLTHSVPYLTKGAAEELSRIADAFTAKLADNGLPYYRLVVNSVLRTQEDVTRLRRSGNVNATENSAHSYATTYDISYTKYRKSDDSDEVMDPYELTKVLGEVLRDERAAGRCYVKYERKQHCFHITSRVK